MVHLANLRAVVWAYVTVQFLCQVYDNLNFALVFKNLIRKPCRERGPRK